MAERSVTPIAVIGMACRLPGGIDSPEQLWDALLRGDDLVTEIPAERWDVEEYYDAERGVPGRSISRWGAYLNNAADFDPEFFGLDDRKATVLDPQHRVLLEASWEAIEHAGIAPDSLAGSATGVFMGLSHEDYTGVSLDTGGYAFTGTNSAMASGRIAYTLNVNGPAMTVDTACSSGLLSVHLAAGSLHTGESDLALAGGCMIMLEPRKNPWASSLGMLSPNGRCRAFDVAADGFVRSEGCAVVLLKRLPDALRDGDRILAVVRGTASNSDGRTRTISTPSVPAQVAACRAALATAGVDADTIGMVEAHGTGTPVGDPIEFASLAQVYGAAGKPCLLGSAKSNFGHTESAAGTLGLIKAVLSLQHGVVPPMVHFTRLPDELAQIDTGLVVPTEITQWPAGYDEAPRRAAVSSYGISGMNVHAIVEQAPEAAHDEDPARSTEAGPLVFALSSSSADALRRTSRRLADWVEQQPDSVTTADLAYTLARRRAHRPVRTAVVAGTRQELTERLREVADGEDPYRSAVGHDDRGPVWVFSGQGSQWAAMGADLLVSEPQFAARVAEAEPLIAREAGFSVTEALSAPETVTGIDRVQPTLFTMQVALAAVMQSYGVTPGAVIGHSMGEAAAAVVAGALSLDDGVRVICRRSRMLATLSGAGAMASVELPAQRVRDELAAAGIHDAVVAVVASPQSTVIGGETHTVRKLVAGWEQQDVMAREVAVDIASHSPQVDPILDDLADALADLSPMKPTIPFYSATSFDPRERPACDADYWVDNLRHMVRFAAAVQAALEDGHRVFAELAPHPLLTRAIEQTAQGADMPAAVLASLRREQPLPFGLRGFLSDLYSAGAAVDFSVLHPSGRLLDVPLPAWNHRRLLLTRDRAEHQKPGANLVSVHPLLGPHVRLLEATERHAWQAEVGTTALPWLGDHQIHNVAALPGAAYCEMALAAARETLGEAAAVRDIRFEQMLLLDEETPVSAVASGETSGVLNFVVESEQEGELARRASASLHAVAAGSPPGPHDIADLLAAHPIRVDGAELRQGFDKRGIQFGPAFTGLVAANVGDGSSETVLAEVTLPRSIRSQQAGYAVHPALLDVCFQSVAAHPALHGVSTDGLLLPLGVREMRAYGPTRNARYCYTTVTTTDGTNAEADIEILDGNGTVLLTVQGLQMGSGVTEANEGERVLNARLLAVEWQHRALPEVTEGNIGPWLLISTSDSSDLLATKLTDALKLDHADVATMSWPQGADDPAHADELRRHLATGGFAGVVVLTAPRNGYPEDQCAARGGAYARHLVRIARELPESAGELPRLYVVTRKAQTVLPGDRANLEQAGLRGLVRVIGAEHPQLRATQIDVDELTGADLIAQQLLGGSEEDETAWRSGDWYAARLVPSPLQPEERRTTVVDHERDGMRLQIRTPGDLQTMELVAFDRVPPGPGEIEVAVAASSINFADVLAAFGRCPNFEGRQPPLGMDFTGVVTAVGPDVTAHQVGDHVGGMSSNGCWGTFLTCDANLAVTIPDGLSDDQAAAVSTAAATAWYGLNDLAKISAGDKVLIHSGTGGVGQAAIAIARAAGAEIFATAGSQERRELLYAMGIEHVYDSRSTEFAEQIRQDTDGYGVDIVLNSLTGAAQRAGLELLSMGGRFVEIGKADIYGDTRLGLFPFRKNLSFYGVDLALMCISHPEKMRDLLATVYQLTADGVLPLPEYTKYPLADAATAIRVMSAAEHTGKLLLSPPRVGHNTVAVPPETARIFRNDGAYIVTGGLGGLGLFLAARMAEGGCGRIVLNSRSQPGSSAQDEIERIRATGADIQVECGDIAEPETVDRLVSVATATGLPVRGVLHAAAVVEDATLTNITDELIDRDWAPKVYGAWHLHHATATQPVDWFCSFSSAAALLGSPGQGAYAAANSWLDGFTLWRRSQDLPATAIAWGAWSEIGRGTALAESGDTTMIAPDEGARAFEALLRHHRAYTGYAPIIGTPWAALVARSPYGEAFESAGQGAMDATRLDAELRSLPSEEWPDRVRRLVSEQVGLILRRSVDPDRAISEYGLDSLGNLELRTRIETETGIRVRTVDVTTVRALAGQLCESLAASAAGPATSS